MKKYFLYVLFIAVVTLVAIYSPSLDRLGGDSGWDTSYGGGSYSNSGGSDYSYSGSDYLFPTSKSSSKIESLGTFIIYCVIFLGIAIGVIFKYIKTIREDKLRKEMNEPKDRKDKKE